MRFLSRTKSVTRPPLGEGESIDKLLDAGDAIAVLIVDLHESGYPVPQPFMDALSTASKMSKALYTHEQRLEARKRRPEPPGLEEFMKKEGVL